MASHIARSPLVSILVVTLLAPFAQALYTQASLNGDYSLRASGTANSVGDGGWALVGVMTFDGTSECSATFSFTYHLGGNIGSSALTTELPSVGSCTYEVNADGTGQVNLELVSSPDIGFTNYVMNLALNFHSIAQFDFTFSDSHYTLVGDGAALYQSDCRTNTRICGAP